MQSEEKRAFDRAREAALLAREKLEAVRSTADVDSAIVLWAEFLVNHHRCFSRLRKATEKGASKGWFDKIKHQRSSDDLLLYVHQARDADEHGVERIVNRYRTGISISPKPGTEMGLSTLSIIDGVVSGDFQSPENVIIERIPGCFTLTAVRNRGVSFPLPTSHLGQPIIGNEPLVVGNYAQIFIEKMIVDAAVFFGV